MKGKKILVAVVSVFILLSVVQVAHGRLPDYTMSPTQLEGYCNDQGGTYFPPGVGGAYACILPDGSLISCGGAIIPICTVATRTVPDGTLSGSTSLILQMQLDIVKKLDDLVIQVGALLEADLVALTAPGSTAPGGFCQRDNEGDLHVVVYNQGGTNAGASTTRVVFGCGNPNLCTGPTTSNLPTPALVSPGGSADLEVQIPNSCFDGNNNCNFEIGIDVGNVVLESNETNNNVAGVCGAQIL